MGISRVLACWRIILQASNPSCGHDYIHQNQIRMLLLRLLDRFLPVIRRDTLVGRCAAPKSSRSIIKAVLESSTTSIS